jgi:hypothetical protein
MQLSLMRPLFPSAATLGASALVSELLGRLGGFRAGDFSDSDISRLPMGGEEVNVLHYIE